MSSRLHSGVHLEATVTRKLLPLWAVLGTGVGIWFSLSPVVWVGLFVLTLCGLSRFLAIWNLARIELEHRLPLLVFVGEDVSLTVMARNVSPIMESFQVELSHELILPHKHGHMEFSVLAPDQVSQRVVNAHVRRRGIYDQFDCSIISYFPLGMRRAQKDFSLSARLVVVPEPELPPELLHLLSSGTVEAGQRENQMADFTGDFKSLREYRYGDHAKCISWPRSVQMDQIIVRETEQLSPARAVVIFHSYQPQRVRVKQPNFERSLRQLSGLCSYFREQSVVFDFVASFNQWTPIPVNLDETSVSTMLESLAGAEFEATSDMDDVTAAIRASSGRSAAIIVVSNTPMGYWANLLPQGATPILCLDNHQAMNADAVVGV